MNNNLITTLKEERNRLLDLTKKERDPKMAIVPSFSSDAFVEEKREKLKKMLEKRGYRYYEDIRQMALHLVLPRDPHMALQLIMSHSIADGITCVAPAVGLKAVAITQHSDTNDTHRLMVLVHEVAHVLTIYKDEQVATFRQGNADVPMAEAIAYAVEHVVGEQWGVKATTMAAWGLAQYSVGDLTMEVVWPTVVEAANIILKECE